jgi:penicillin-insensitive murein DD-endopeptidase
MRTAGLILMTFSITVSAQFTAQIPLEVRQYMAANKDDGKESKAVGSASRGKLINGKLFPYKGVNFSYFEKQSYLNGHAFLHKPVKEAVLEMYDSLWKRHPNRYFVIMECSAKVGGEIPRHRTHRNGTSIDFMMPLKKDGKAYYGLDTIGWRHFGLAFDKSGRYLKDKSIRIDFDLVSEQIVLMNAFVRKRGYKIKKVIIKIELKDELYASAFGKRIKNDGIYVVMGLSKKVNEMHDDHYHIDFEPK